LKHHCHGGLLPLLDEFKEGTVKPFVTSTFDGSSVVVTRLMFDRAASSLDVSLWWPLPKFHN